MIPVAIDAVHEPAVLALNNANAQELSWLDASALRALLQQCYSARRIGEVDAFLLALDHTAAYDSPNYAWLKARYERFVYVDRIAVAPQARGRGFARLLYEDLFGRAKSAGHALVVCEVNTIPPNPASDAFHAALGFTEVGRAVLEGRGKSVRYLARRL